MKDTPEKDLKPYESFTVPDTSSSSSKRFDFMQNTDIPDNPVRIGYGSVDTGISQLLVDLESKFEIEARRSRKILAYIANSDVLQQKWEVREWEDE